MRRVLSSFDGVFCSCPENVKLLIKDGIKKYSRFRKNRSRLELFLNAQGFQVVEYDIDRTCGFGEIYTGYMEIFSLVCIAEQFAPVSVMIADIAMNNVRINISSDWMNFHEDDEESE